MICLPSQTLRFLLPAGLLTACLLLMLIIGVAGCDPTGVPDGSEAPNGEGVLPITEGSWYRPALETRWQWQLQPDAVGRINTAYDVEAYDIDLFDAPDSVIAELHAQGRKVVGYFSAGTYESFRSDAGEFQPAEMGNALEDFPNERWLDIRSDNVRRIMLARLDQAVVRGFDGIEPDNVDGYANDSGFPLTPADQLAFNRFIANEAHKRNLSVGLKNDLDQIGTLVEYFDFAVNEQCHEFDECDRLQPFVDAGKPVFNAEYAAGFVNEPAIREQMCTESLDRNLRTLVLPLDLDDSFRFGCD